jgi:protein CMS1
MQRPKSSGAPTLLFLTGAALRGADVTRTLKNKMLQGDKGGGVAKLFAKHFKLEEHVEHLKKTKIGSAVGTPGRIGKLLCETGKSVTGRSCSSYLNVFISRCAVGVCSNTYRARYKPS